MNGVAGPNLLHFVLLVLAAGCVVSMLREASGKAVSPSRLAAPPTFAAICALLFFVLSIGTGFPSWTFAVALAIGLGAGAVRGWTMKLRVDHMFGIARVPKAPYAFLAGVVLLAAVLLEIGSALVGAATSPVRWVALDLTAARAGVLIGRASAIAVRWNKQPHRDLRSTVNVE